MNWERVRLGEAFEFQKKSKTKAGEGLDKGEYPFYTSSEILSKFLNEYHYEGDALVFGTGGKASVHYNGDKFSVSTDCFVIKPQNDDVFVKYVYYYLSGNIYLLEEGFKGAGLKHISKEYLSQIEIPLPPMSVQKEMVEKLDKAAAIREKSKALLAHYDALAESLFIELFGDPISNEKGWEKKKLGEVGNLSSGSTPSREKKSYFLGDIPWVKTTEVKGEIILETEEKISQEALKETSCKLNPKGSIVIAMYGQGKTRGRIGILGIDAATNQACCVIEKNEKVNSVFLFNQLKMLYQDLRNLGRGGNQPNLNVGILKDYKILFPPLSLQIKFAEMVENIEEQKARAKAEIEQSEAVFQALLQDSFG